MSTFTPDPSAPALAPRPAPIIHRAVSRRLGRCGTALTACFLLYLLLPMVLVIIGALGKTWTNTLLPSGFTLTWFAQLWEDTSFHRAFDISLLVAGLCCLCTAVIGLPLAYTLHARAKARGAWVARVITLLPVGVPALTLGFGYIVIFSGDTFPWLGSWPLLVAAHVILTLPYLTQTLLSDLRHLDIDRLEDCAATLGASPTRQFLTITLPSLRHSIMAGLVMVSALSIGEFQVSNLIAGFRYRNYPVVLLQAFYGATGMACAATVILLALAVLATLGSIAFTDFKKGTK